MKSWVVDKAGLIIADGVSAFVYIILLRSRLPMPALDCWPKNSVLCRVWLLGKSHHTVIACTDCFRTQQFHALLDHYCSFCPILPFLSKLFCFYVLWSSLVTLGGKGRKFPYAFSYETELWMVLNYTPRKCWCLWYVCIQCKLRSIILQYWWWVCM